MTKIIKIGKAKYGKRKFLFTPATIPSKWLVPAVAEGRLFAKEGMSGSNVSATVECDLFDIFDTPRAAARKDPGALLGLEFGYLGSAARHALSPPLKLL